MRFMILAAIAAFALTMNASSASAAKGSKKNAAGEHVVHGVVGKVEIGNNGQGTFVLHIHHAKGSQGKNANAGAGQAGKGAAQGGAQAGKGANGAGQGAGKGKKGHKINVDQNTKIEIGAGGKGQAGSASQLKAGEHVTVHLKGKEAEKIVIHTRTKGKKKAA